MARGLMILLFVAAAVVAILALIWPGALAVTEMLTTADWSSAALTPRRLRLLLNGLLIAAGTGVLALLPGSALAGPLVRGGTGGVAAAWLCATVLLTPPYLYAYAWSLPPLPGGVAIGTSNPALWPTWLTGATRALICLCTWTAPVAAGVLAAGWRCGAASGYEQALLDARPWRALRTGALPLLTPWIGLSVAVVALLALTEFSVCHLCLVPTWNTEILAEVQTLGPTGRAMLLAWPQLALLGVAVGLLLPFRALLRDWLAQRAAEESPSSSQPHPPRAPLAALLAVTLLVFPALILLAYVKDHHAWGRAWQTFPPEDLRDGPRYALLAALLAAVLGFAGVALHAVARTANSHPRRRCAQVVAWLLTLAALGGLLAPPGLVGDAFAAAYARIPLIGEHWIVLSLLGVARFAGIAVVVGWLLARSLGSELQDAARADGADATGVFRHVLLQATTAPLATAAVIAGLLTFTEVAASVLVRPPGAGSLAVTLLNQIHFGRNDEVIVMLLGVAALIGGAALLLVCANRAARLFDRARSMTLESRM